MSYKNPRIKSNHGFFDMLIAMAGSNEDAMSVLVQTAQQSPNIDPDSILGPVGPMLGLDTLHVYEQDIQSLYVTTGSNINTFLAVLRGNQLGFVPSLEIKMMISNPEMVTQYRLDVIKQQVKNHLPRFRIVD